MEYQVPPGRPDVYEELVDQIFTNSSTRGVDYFATKEVAKLQGIEMTSVRDPKQHNKTLLHIAAGFGRKSWVNNLLKDGAKVDAQDDEKQTPLHAACNHAHKTVAWILIQAGADVNLADSKGWSALHFTLARLENKLRVQPLYWEVVELLLACGADPYLQSSSKRNCLARISDAEQRRYVRLNHLTSLLREFTQESPTRESLIEKYLTGEDFFEIIKVGDEDVERIKMFITPRLLKKRLVAYDYITPLHRAAGYNQLKVAKLLIEKGADVNAIDGHGRIPLHNAAKYGHIEMIELLVEGGSDVDRQDLEGHSPIHEAATNKTSNACLRLIELGANKCLRTKAGELPYDLADSGDAKEVLSLDKLQQVASRSGQAIYISFQEDQTSFESISRPAHFISEPDSLLLDSTSEERLFSNPKHDIRKINLNKNDRTYQIVEQRMLDSIVCHANDLGGQYSYDIISIELIQNQKVWTKYRLACQILEVEFRGSKNEKLLFHGSNLVDKIQTHGFDERYAQRNGMFGAGLYFADHSSKSNQYTFGFGQGCKEHKDKYCHVCERKIIYAQVALGKSLIVKEANPDYAHAPPGCSSVTGHPDATDGLVYPEYVIYKGDHAYPLFVITYRTKPSSS